MLSECVLPEIPPTSIDEDFTDEKLRLAVRAMLPAEVFERRPWRLLYAVVMLAGIVACGWGAMHTPWYFAVPLSILGGHFYAMLMFFAHEVAHGAVTRSKFLQDSVLFIASTIYCLSPKLWRVWHNGVHHGHANVDHRDPDIFGTVRRYEESGWFRRIVVNCAPGSGRALSLAYPFLFFSGLTQGILWSDSVHLPDFRALNRRRAFIETALMIAFWIGLSILTGWRGTLYLVLIPMLIANGVIMSYIFTNHLFRPLVDRPSALDGTMSVTSPRVLDRLHFHFSHHIEHHLFPAVGSLHYPLVRKALKELAGDRYLAPPHWWALVTLYRTPRVHVNAEEFIEPITQRRVTIASVEELLSYH